MNNATAKELLASNKWQLLESDDFQGFAEDVLTRYIEDVRQEYLDTLVVFLKTWTDANNYTDDTTPAAPTITTPMVQKGKTRAGVWYGGRISYKWVEVDKLPKLRLFQTLYKGNVTVASVETENSCSYNVDTTYYFKVPTLETLPAADVTLAINYERGGVSRDPETGTYTYWIAKRTRLYQKIAEYTSQIDAEEKVLSTHHRGVKAGDKDDAGADIGLNSMTAAVAGESREQHREKNADCSQDINETRRQITDRETDRSVVRADETLDEEQHSAAAVPVTDPPVPIDGEIKEAINEVTPFKDRTKTTISTRTVVDQTFDRGVVTAAETLAETRHTAAAGTVTDPPVPAAGEIKEAENRPTPYKNKTETIVRTRTAVNQQFDKAIVRADETVDEERHSAAAAPVTDPPVPGDGEIKEIENNPTPYKDKTETIARTRTVVDQTATGTGTSDRKQVTAAETVTEVHHTAAAAAAGDPTPGAGTIVEVVNKPTPYKNKTETIVQTRAITDQQFDRTVVEAGETLDEERHSAATGPVTDPPVPAGGEIKEIENRPTPYASRTETIARTRTAVDQTSTAGGKHDGNEENYDETIEVEEHTAATAALADVAKAEGVVTKVESKPTAFKDRFLTRKTTWTGLRQAWSHTWNTLQGTAFYKRVTNATAVEEAADTDLSGLDATSNSTVSGGMNRLGLRDYTIGKSVPAGGAGLPWPETTGSDVVAHYKVRYRRIYSQQLADYVDQVRVWTFETEVKQFATYHGASEWVDDVPNWEGWGISGSTYRYVAKRVTLVDDSGWNTDPDA
jgi:hypothetical protein